ncbi:MAG: hypothetical protein E7270_08295 [Lachnospiraceae bacterium]|nr:hypothetical protein [Lachnospiraceae bacterium]
MKCIEFQRLIPDFINDNILNEDKYEYLEGFIEHSKECPECYDELEIHYMIMEGLDKLENDSKTSFNFKEELRMKLNMHEENIYNEFKINVIVGVINVIAQITLFVGIIMYFVRLL